MSTDLQQKSIINPDLTEVLRIVKQDILASLNAVKVGEIRSVDAAKKTAQVQLLFKRVLPDETVQSYPLLVDCPLFTLQGNGAYVQMPITAGDQCLVLFSDRRLDEWFQNGAEAAPGDPRCHDLSDGIAVVGLNALNSNLPAYPADFIRMANGSTEIDLKTAELDLAGGGSTLTLKSAEAALMASVGGKVKIGNGTTTLATLMVLFITLLEAIAVQDDEGGAILPLTPAYIALLEAFKLQFQGLLL